jgi:hypothetical protein
LPWGIPVNARKQLNHHRYLQIPVIDTSAMAVVNSVDQLLEIFPRVVLLEPPTRSLDHENAEKLSAYSQE